VIRLLLLLLLLVPAGWSAAEAHELHPGFLEIREEAPEDYALRFKVPARGDLRLALYVRLPETCVERKPATTEYSGGGYIDRLAVTCAGGLQRREVFIDGLAATFTDVVVRVELASGAVQAARLTPDDPYFTVIDTPTWRDTARTYFLLGVEHILLGIDHLLFVLALLLLVRKPWMLVKTVTAFTVAHSITLALAVLGWAAAPQPPVEAVIALSIAFAAAEVVRERRAGPGLAARLPWIMAFGFGLLHGFGFGGALKEIGLPQTDVPLAFLSFNLGIEAGQLLFVAAVVALAAALKRLFDLRLVRLREGVAYGIGGIAGFRFLARVGGFWA
jgi:hydrogenase/urease accessory protein HupE